MRAVLAEEVLGHRRWFFSPQCLCGSRIKTALHKSGLSLEVPVTGHASQPVLYLFSALSVPLRDQPH